MTAKLRTTIEEQFYNYKTNSNPLWKEVFDRTLIVCESKVYADTCYAQIMRLLYIEHKPRYIVLKILGITDEALTKKKRAIKGLAYHEAKRFNLL